MKKLSSKKKMRQIQMLNKNLKKMKKRKDRKEKNEKRKKQKKIEEKLRCVPMPSHLFQNTCHNYLNYI